LITTLYSRRKDDDPNASILLQRLKHEGFESLKEMNIETVFRLEGINEQNAQTLLPLFHHPVFEVIGTKSSLQEQKGPIVEIGYQRAVTDPELPSILRGAASMGISDVEWVRIAHRYQFIGIDDKTAQQIADRYLYNKQVEVLISSKEKWETLKPQGKPGPVERMDLESLDTEALLKLSDDMRLFLNLEQMEALQSISKDMGRPFTDAELEMFAQTWSDHCFHTTWRSLGLLEKLWKTTREIDHHLVLSVFEDNAGVVDFYDGWALTIKGETHNSPSAISPYGGIMTKHGGVIRDTLGCGQGAWPIGGSTVMGLGDPSMEWEDVPKGALHPKTILMEAIRGTADYTNPMGIPMMFPIYRFHPGYTGKCFALGHSIGMVPSKRAPKGKPNPGDLVILIGGPTGRDGIHGATVSSGSMTSETAVVDAAHVQIGMPIEERKFMEAIPVLRDEDCLRAITDLGAAGLSSAAGEMGSDTGIWINLARVHLKTEGMRPWEIWVSESQERMLLCVLPEKASQALDILKRFEVPSAIIGIFTNSMRCQVVFNPSADLDPLKLEASPPMENPVVDLDFKDLRKGCPLPEIQIKKPERDTTAVQVKELHTEEDWNTAIQNVLSHINICDQSIAGTQFDSTVQGFTVTGPYGGKNKRMPNDIWLSAPLRGKPFGVATAVGFNPFYGDIDPAIAARLMILDPVSKLIAAGVLPNDIVLCDNFYMPRVTPEIAWALISMVDMCCDVSKKLGTPFISGKDSSSGTFVGENGFQMDVPPTLAVLALGRMADVNQAVPKSWKNSGNNLFLVGPLSEELGGSIFWDTKNQRGNSLPNPSVEDLQKMWKQLRPLQEEGILLSVSCISEGGLIRKLFEMALGNGLGCQLDMQPLQSRLRGNKEAVLFGEMIGAMIIEISTEHESRIESDLQATYLGKTTSDPKLEFQMDNTLLQLVMEELIQVWEKPFHEVIG